MISFCFISSVFSFGMFVYVQHLFDAATNQTSNRNYLARVNQKKIKIHKRSFKFISRTCHVNVL